MEKRVMLLAQTYNDSTLAPSTIPMTRYVGYPIALAPNAWSDGDFRIELYTHLEVSFEDWLRDGEGARGR